MKQEKPIELTSNPRVVSVVHEVRKNGHVIYFIWITYSYYIFKLCKRKQTVLVQEFCIRQKIF